MSDNYSGRLVHAELGHGISGPVTSLFSASSVHAARSRPLRRSLWVTPNQSAPGLVFDDLEAYVEHAMTLGLRGMQ